MNTIEGYQNLIEFLKKALAFYADSTNYSGAMGTIAPIALDEYGSQARFALEKAKELEYLSESMEDEFVNTIKNAIMGGIESDEIIKIIGNFKNMIDDNNIQ